jgi:hypothetical protein
MVLDLFELGDFVGDPRVVHPPRLGRGGVGLAVGLGRHRFLPGILVADDRTILAAEAGSRLVPG